MSQINLQTRSFSGFCARCNNIHSIPVGNSEKRSLELMELLEKRKTLALESTSLKQQSRFSTTSLFGPERGKMFGVMECMAADGSFRTIKAFSGQFNGSWTIEGWCPPLFEVSAFEQLTGTVEKKIKALGTEMANCERNSEKWTSIKRQRKTLSQRLMREIHKIYELHNFNGENLRLADLFDSDRGIPTGTGDCCAPKLLNYAAKNRLHPLGLSEFYWGRDNLSGSRRHGVFYLPCDDKCRPIIGAMLCGLNT